MVSLENKVVFITGAAGLIGRELVKTVVKSGGVAIIADLDLERATDFHQDIEKNFGEKNSLPILVDINSFDSVKKAISDTVKVFGKVDALINNAYPRNKHYGADFLEVEKKDFDENVSMHLGGYFLVCQQFIKYFRSQGYGNIINLASIYGCVAPKFEIYEGTSMTVPVEYAVIKSAIIHMTKYMAKYVKSDKIRINCISPGGILDGQPKSFVSNYRNHCVNYGMLDVEDLLPAFNYLLSDGSSAMTGQNLIIDDGFCL